MRTKVGTTVTTSVLALALCAGMAWAGPPRHGVVTPWGADRALFDHSSAGGVGLRSVGPGLHAAADHIVDQQCGDGGWGWPHDDCSATYNNITGPIALGLLQAYEMTAAADHLSSAKAGGDFDLTSQYGTGEPRFSTGTPYFLWTLSAATGDSTYSDWAAVEFYDALTAGTYGPSAYDTAGWIGAVEAGRAGGYINLRPWEFETLGVTAGAIGNAGQKDLFNQATLNGLATLDNTDPDNVWWDLLGLAGGVRGLALNGSTSFAAISAPSFSAINGIDNLCDLADVLAGYQNADGSWYWASGLATPGEGDKDAQTTAYAVMALVAARDAGCGGYDDEIAAGRDWLWSMQDSDGGFFSYPGGTHNTEVEGEILSAMSCPSEVWVDDDYCLACDNDGHAWGYDAFDNIQDGVDAVCGSTVYVLPGLYEEQVHITTNDVDIIGSGCGTNPAVDSIIQSPASLGWYFDTGLNNYPIVGFDGVTGGSIQNMRVDGLGRGNANYRFIGIGFWNAGGDAFDCAVTGIRDEPLSGAQHGVGIYACNDGAGGPYVINVTGTDVDDYQKNGIALSGDNLTIAVVGCTVTGGGTMGSGLPAQNGIQVSYGAGGVVENCTVSQHLYTESWASTGILLYGGTTVDMTGNMLFDNNPGVYCIDTVASFDDGLISNQHADSCDALYAINSGAKRGSAEEFKQLAQAAPVLENAPLRSGSRNSRSFTCNNSTFTGHGRADSFGVYVKAESDTMTATMTWCRVTGWDLGVYAREDGGTVSMTANNNAFENNGAYGGFYTDAAAVQDVENNWWGDASGPYDGSGVDEADNPPCYDPSTMVNADGLGDAVSDAVADYCPWLTNPLNSLVLEAVDCQDDTDGGLTGHQIEVELWMRNVTADVTGFTAFVEFDDAKLSFVSGTYTSDPFPWHIPSTIATLGTPYDNVVEAGSYMQGDPPDPRWPGVTGDWLLATLVFTVADDCDTTDLTLTSFGPFGSELSFQGVPVSTNLVGTPIIRLDDTPPVIDVCPADPTVVECDGAGNAAELDAWLASFAAHDDCSGVTLTDDFASLSDDCGATGSATVTFTATDECGNQTSCQSTFTIQDTVPPDITTVASDLTVECDGAGNTAELNAWLASNGGAAASDDCGGVAWSNDFTALSDGCCATGLALVTFTATDDCGLTSTTAATFTIVDTTSPSISGCPDDIVVNADAGLCTAVVSWTPPTATDSCCEAGDITVTPSHNPGDVFGLGTTTVTYTFEDACGNWDTCQFDVTVNAVNDVVGVVVELQGVDADDWPDSPLTRCIKFTARNSTSGLCAEPVHVWVEFYDTGGSVAIGVAPTFEIECGVWDELCAKDEQHTLYDAQALTVVGTEYQTTVDLYLLAGDTDNDSDVDIHDVTWLMYQWGLGASPAVYGDCPWDGTRDADFSNDNWFTATDYLLLSNNWHEWSTCPCAPVPGSGGLAALPLFEAAMEVSVSASMFSASVAEHVDLNRDGVVDHQDVREFEDLYGLPNLLSAKIEAAALTVDPAAEDVEAPVNGFRPQRLR